MMFFKYNFNHFISTSYVLVCVLEFINIRQCESNQSLAMNVTRLLDKLLTNYSKSLRPTHELGVPTIIDTNININSLGPISNFDMVILELDFNFFVVYLI